MIFRAKARPKARVKIKIIRANGDIEYPGTLSYYIKQLKKRIIKWLQYMYKTAKK